MATVRPFRALRPPTELAAQVASLPYDVMSAAEARAMAGDNELSFLHVTRPEIDLPEGIDPYDDRVYEQGRIALDAFIANEVLQLDGSPTFSVYRQQMGDHVQTGIVALAAVDEYESGVIAKHELTRPEKELDRVRHIDSLSAQDEPVFLLSPGSDIVDGVTAEATARVPDYEMVTDDGISHTLWVIADDEEVQQLIKGFEELPCLYVADGHHRSAAAWRVRQLRRDRGLGGVGWQPHDGLLTVIFDAGELMILPYHRVVTDLGDGSLETLLAGLAGHFQVSTADGPSDPTHRHVFDMYAPGQWYRLEVLADSVDESDPVARLDVSVLQDRVLAPLIGATDPRTDPRLTFVGGIRGTAELQRLVDGGDAAVAFALHPTSVDDLITLADAGEIMPPKSTWFEPKLRSGLFVHPLGN